MYTEADIDELLIKAYYSLRRYGILELSKAEIESHLKPAYFLFSNLESYYGMLANKVIFTQFEKDKFIKDNITPYIFTLTDIDKFEKKRKRKNLYDWAALMGIQIPAEHKHTEVAAQWADYTDMINDLFKDELIKINKEYLDGVSKND